MGLFSDLEKYGIKSNIENEDIIQKKNPVQQEKKITPIVVEKKEEDFIYSRHYKCPVCDMDFMAMNVKASGIKAIGRDTDLRPIYDVFDPLKYDAISCDKCGYSAISRYFKEVTTKQSKLIKEQLGSSFSGLDNILPKYSYDDALVRHKLALVCSVAKQAKNSERAYTCLKLAWILRGKMQTLNIKDEQEKELIKELYRDEKECILNAYEGFMLAITKENYPIAGMDEITMKYLLADLARKLKKFDVAMRFVSDILTSKTAANRIKDEALKEKELIKRDMNAATK